MYHKDLRVKRNLNNEFMFLEQNVLNNDTQDRSFVGIVDPNTQSSVNISHEELKDINKVANTSDIKTALNVNNTLVTQTLSSPIVKQNDYSNDITRLIANTKKIDSPESCKRVAVETAKLVNKAFNIPSSEIIQVYNEIVQQLVPICVLVFLGVTSISVIEDYEDDIKYDIVLSIASIIGLIGMFGIVMYCMVWSYRHQQEVNRMFLNQKTKEFIIWLKRKLVVRHKFFTNPIVIIGSISLATFFYFLANIFKKDLPFVIMFVFGYAKNIIKTVYIVIQSLLRFLSKKVGGSNLLLFGNQNLNNLFKQLLSQYDDQEYENMTWEEFVQHQEDIIDRELNKNVYTKDNITISKGILGWASAAIIIVFLVIIVNLIVKNISYGILLSRIQNIPINS